MPPTDDATTLTAGLAYVRQRYQVPAAALIRVEVQGRPGTIVGAAGRLLVSFPGQIDPGVVHPTWEIQYLPAAGDAPHFLTLVAAGEVYRVGQRSASYAVSREDGRRHTKMANLCERLGLVALTGRVNGSMTDYELTAEGRATVEANRRLLEEGPFTPPVPDAETRGVTEGEWLVWSHDAGSWWGPNGCRYTRDITQAGRYTLDEATRGAGMRTWPSPTRPPEVVVAAPSPGLLASPDLHPVMQARIRAATRDAVAARAAATTPTDVRVAQLAGAAVVCKPADAAGIRKLAEELAADA